MLLIVDHCLVNMNMPASKLGTLEMCPQTQNGEFIEKVLYDFD
jgi:hypothetical protein